MGRVPQINSVCTLCQSDCFPFSSPRHWALFALAFLSSSKLLLGNKTSLEDFGLSLQGLSPHLYPAAAHIPSQGALVGFKPQDVQHQDMTAHSQPLAAGLQVTRVCQHGGWCQCEVKLNKFKPFLSVSLQGLFCTQVLSGQFFDTKAIALSGCEIKHFYKTHLLRLTSSFSHI